MIESLFSMMLAEVVLGGGGRVFALGPVTARMLFFAACLVAWFGTMLTTTGRRQGQATALWLVLFFLISLLPGIAVSISQDVDTSKIVLELQPILFWLTAPFVALVLQDQAMIRRSGNIILYGGAAVAILTIMVSVGLQLGLLPFGTIYGWSSDSGEIFFRSRSTFFFKGHFFVALSLIFCLSIRPKWWRLIAVINVVSVALSLTRGLYLAVVISVALSLISSRRPVAIFFMALGGITITIFYGHLLVDIVFDPSRQMSSKVRSKDLMYFIATFDSSRLLFGDGAGFLLNGRQNVENSFLWAIWRFGILGLSFWLTPFFICLKYFRDIPQKDEEYRLASAFFYGVLLIYVVSLFNPAINNSIGITYLICAIFSLQRLSRNNKAIFDIVNSRVTA